MFYFWRIFTTRLWNSRWRNLVRLFLVIIFFFYFSLSWNSALLLLSALPKFSVKLSVPPYILKTNKWIKINITTRYNCYYKLTSSQLLEIVSRKVGGCGILIGREGGGGGGGGGFWIKKIHGGKARCTFLQLVGEIRWILMTWVESVELNWDQGGRKP